MHQLGIKMPSELWCYICKSELISGRKCIREREGKLHIIKNHYISFRI